MSFRLRYRMREGVDETRVRDDGLPLLWKWLKRRRAADMILKKYAVDWLRYKRYSHFRARKISMGLSYLKYTFEWSAHIRCTLVIFSVII